MPSKSNNGEGLSGRGNRDEQHNYTPYLFMHCNGTDTGDRPLVPNPSTGQLPCYYVSPDISVSPIDKNGNVVAGQEVTITATVHNGGKKAALPCVTVKFFVFDSSLAFTEANGLFPDTPTIQPGKQIRPGGSIEVTCPRTWTPRSLEHGHPCIVVQCSTPEEGNDGLKSPFFPVLDRHVAQRNMTVIEPQNGLELHLQAGNPFEKPLPFTLRLSSLLIYGNFEELRKDNVRTLMTLLAQVQIGAPSNLYERGLEIYTKDITEQDLGVRLEKTEPQEKPGDQGPAMPFESFLQQLTGNNPDFNPQGFGKVLGEFVAEPGFPNKLIIAVPPTDRGGDGYIVHHLTQVVENVAIGGYTLVVPPMNF